MTTNRKEEWKKRMDSLRVKLELGKDDVKEGLAELDEELSAFLAKLKVDVDQFVDEHPQAQQVKGRLEAMRVQLALAEAEGREALELETRKLRDKLHAWKWDALDWLKEKKDERSERIREALDDEFEFYTAQLELINVRAHLGKADVKDKWDKLRDDLKVKLQELRTKVEAQAEEKWDDTKKDFAVKLRKWADRLE